MECIIKGKECREIVSVAAERAVIALIKKFEVWEHSEYGFSANSDGGLEDMHYINERYPLVPESFVIDGDRVVGYEFEKHRVDFDGSEETLILKWDDTDYGGAQDCVDRGEYRLVKKK